MRTRLVAVLVPVLLAACTSNEGRKTSAPTGGTLVFAAPGDATDLFPPFVTEANGRVISDLLFDHLADISMDLQTAGDKAFRPRLAKSWTWAPDSLSIAFALDPRAHWHDGKPVTAADVRYSLRLFIDPKTATPNAALLANLDSASVKDSLTVVIWFKKHTPEQFYDVAYQLYIVPEHVYGAVPFDSLRTSNLTRVPIGSGQFRFVRWQADVRIELVADTANYHGRPSIDRIIMTPVGDAAVMRTQLLTGQADLMQNYPPDMLGELDSSTVVRPLVTPTLQYVYLGMNLYAPKSKNVPHPLFSDVRVRRALSMAVDRVAMLHSVFGDKGRLGHGPFPMTLSAADSTLKAPPFDTAAANALLDSAGWRRGRDGVRHKLGTALSFHLMVPGISVPRVKYALFIQEQLGRVGAHVEIDKADSKSFVARLQPGGKAGDFDAVLNSFSTDPSPSGTRQAWGTAGIGSQGQNAQQYSNARVDALLDSLSLSFDPAKMKAYASRAFQQIIDDAPAIWLYDQAPVDGLNRRFATGPIRADGWWYTLAEWSIPPDKRIDRDKIGLNPPSR